MSVLRDFESRLGGLVEGLFAKTFRSGLQPVELAKRILREMDSGKTVGVGGRVVVPNRYEFRLSQVDRERFADAEHHLIAELGQVVRSGARERAWTLVGPPEIEIDTDDRLKKGVFKCTASLQEGSDPNAAAPAQLQLVENGRHGRVFDVKGPVTTIGREETCDVVLTDPAASRRHAEIRIEGEAYTLIDLGSTNGTQIDGAPIAPTKAQSLEDDDHIQIGETVLEFRRL
jgi:hypothetical protein